VSTASSLDRRAGAQVAAGWRPALVFCAVLWLAQRVLVQGLGLLVTALVGPAPHSSPGFFGQFANWDTGWFHCIARSGYFGPACADGGTVERFAFFPLYPVLARWVAWLAGGGVISDGTVTFGLWLVAAAASFAAVLALFRLVEHEGGTELARRASLLLVLGPYALFMVASYSESLYLATAIAAWYACTRRRYLLCAGLGILATLSRASGLFLVPALLVLYLVTTLRGGRRLRWRDGILVACSGLGVIGYWGWLASRTGDPMAWFHAQDKGWHRSTRWPWDTLLNQGVHVLREPRWDWQVQAVIELVFAAALCVAILLLARSRNWPAVTLVGLTALSLMTSNSYLSLARNTLTLFPLVVLVATLTSGRRRRLVAVLAASVVLLVFNSVQFALGNWAD